MNCSVFIATSVDGFIAREDGAVDWLGSVEGPEGEDYGYKEFMDTVDVLVMGRSTFDKVLTFGEWPYGDKPVVVLTHRPLTPPEGAAIEAMEGSPIEIVEHLAREGAGHLYIDGGETIRSFLQAGLIRRLILSTLPVLIGSGLPLFGSLPGDLRLRLIDSRSYLGGLVQREYEVLEDEVPEDEVPEDQVPEDQVPEDQVPEDEAPEDQEASEQEAP